MIKKILKQLFCFHLQWKHIGPDTYGQKFICCKCNKIKHVDFVDYLLGKNIPISYIEKEKDIFLNNIKGVIYDYK